MTSHFPGEPGHGSTQSTVLSLMGYSLGADEITHISGAEVPLVDSRGCCDSSVTWNCRTEITALSLPVTQGCSSLQKGPCVSVHRVTVAPALKM